jgi:uncharacterized repeat protein (TIGR01451 family)
VNNPTPNVGDTITFTVTLTNHGPNPATNVTVNDSLPAGLALVSATPSQGTYAGGVWVVGTVTTTAPQTLQILAKVASPAAQTNTATISHSDQFDTNPNNNSASATATPQQANLEVTKTVDNASPIFGTSITYTIKVSNHGPDAATNVIVADPLPPGLILIAASPSQGIFNGASGLWSVGTLANGATATLRITAQTAMDGQIVNNAVIRAPQFDPDLSNNQATLMVTVQLSPEQISKFPFLSSTILGHAPVDPALFPQNEKFVAQVYRDLLHRTPDAMGLASWSDVLDNAGARSQVVLAIESSPEYLGDQVDSAYGRLLHRAADAAGRAAFLQFLESGGTIEQMDALIAGSPEYFQTRGGSSNDGFLTALYQDALARPVDAGGRASWDKALAGGSTRTQVATLIFGSPEYKADLVSNYYSSYLRRPADSVGLSTWVPQLLGGATDAQVIADILASDEYFTRIA